MKSTNAFTAGFSFAGSTEVKKKTGRRIGYVPLPMFVVVAITPSSARRRIVGSF
jgi:hypothetical protein